MIGAGTEENGLKSRPPILLVHGDSDDLIPASAMLETTQYLASLEVPAQWHICANLGHGIDQVGLGIGVRFLQDCFTGVG